MVTRNNDDIGATLPFAALQLLAPPVRLVSAAIWKVLKQRDVMQYGVVEEFVTSACQTIPGLLTFRHQAKLILGLRARLILELCRTQPEAEVIAPHLERIRAPAASSVKKDVKIIKTVENFDNLVRKLLTNAAERERFFTEQFLVEYGPKFEQDLEKLLWEFLIRLDQLLPVPSLSQTVSWLSEAPAVLEECAQSATQPQLLNILLQHQTCLGHLESAASLPPNMGDSILASLSLPPSGRVASNHLMGASKPSGERWNGSQPWETSPFITPVIGLIPTETVPVMISARKRAQQAGEAANEQLDSSKNHSFTSVKQREKPKEDGGKEVREQVEDEGSVFLRSSGVERMQEDKSDSETDDEAVVTTSKKKKINRHGRSINQSEEDEAESARDLLHKHGVRKMPEDPLLCSGFASCLSRQPRVVVEKQQLWKDGGKMWKDGGKEVWKQVEDEGSIFDRSSGVKCMQEDKSDSEMEDDEALVTTSKKKKVNRHGRSINQSEEDEAESARDLLREHGVRKIPEDPFLCSVFASCLSRQPRVVVEKLSFVSSGGSSSSGGGGGRSFYKKQVNHRKKLPEWKQTSHHQSSECPNLDNKENQLVLSSVSRPSQQQSNAEATALRGDGDEYVADSEDEGTKNFKGRLFVKRYYKTKHGSYIPTLREFWKPGATRRDVLCAGSLRR